MLDRDLIFGRNNIFFKCGLSTCYKPDLTYCFSTVCIRESKPSYINRKVLAQVQEAAQRVRDELAHRQPRSKVHSNSYNSCGFVTLASTNITNRNKFQLKALNII